MSIGDIDRELEAEAANQVNQLDEVALAFAGLSTLPAWQTAMKYLKETTVDRPTFPAGAPDGVMAAMLQNHREGENNLYRRIEVLVKRGKDIGNGDTN